jgi:nitrate/nitrite transporter NarK
VTVIALIFAVMGVMSTSPVFWTIPSAMLTGAAAAGGIALINAGNALGGWLGPTVFGLVKDATGNDNMALLSLALAPVISAIAVIVVGHDRRTERMPPRI